jgi:hypothetical protein
MSVARSTQTSWFSPFFKWHHNTSMAKVEKEPLLQTTAEIIRDPTAVVLRADEREFVRRATKMCADIYNILAHPLPAQRGLFPKTKAELISEIRFDAALVIGRKVDDPYRKEPMTIDDIFRVIHAALWAFMKSITYRGSSGLVLEAIDIAASKTIASFFAIRDAYVQSLIMADLTGRLGAAPLPLSDRSLSYRSMMETNFVFGPEVTKVLAILDPIRPATESTYQTAAAVKRYVDHHNHGAPLHHQ